MGHGAGCEPLAIPGAARAIDRGPVTISGCCPPKGNYGINDVGYGVYDLYRPGLGPEGHNAGTKDEYLAIIDARTVDR